MADFKVINTQEEFDSAIKDRLERQDKKTREEFKGWMSPDDLKALNEKHQTEIKSLNEAHLKELEKYAGYDEKVSAYEAKIKGLEVSALKTRIANEKKLPFDAIEFLQGEDEESITASAERLVKLSGAQHSQGFVRNTEQAEGDAKDRAYREMLSHLVG